MSQPVKEGEVLAGKYRVERVLGEGGMGVVVAARHIELDELVALKFLLPHVLTVPEAVGRFLREARAAVRIKSEHVARVTDVGQLETGAPYMVMEYLQGQDLGQILTSRGRLPIDEAVDYVAQACEAIAEAHALNIVHRDLKPANLMIVRGSDGAACVKLLDFGISKVSGPGEGLSMTRTTAMLGSPLYMSPEQMMSARDVDGRTDIWALGTILYELLAGEPPFVAETLPALGVLIATTEAPPLRTKRKDVPAGLDAVALKCLAKKREDRFATVGALAEALGPFAPAHAQASIRRAARILSASQGLPGGATGGDQSGLQWTPSVEAATGANVSGTAFNFGQTKSGSGRRRQLLVASGAVLAIVAVVLVAVLRHGSAAPVTPSSDVAAVTPPVLGAPAPPGPSPSVVPTAAPAVVEAVPVLTPPPHEAPSAVPLVTPPTSETPSKAPALARHTKSGAPAAPARPKKSAYEDM